LSGVAAVFVTRDEFAHLLRCGNALIKTLTSENAELDFGHVEPAAVFGRVVEFELAHDAAGLGGRKGLIKRLRLCVLRLSSTTRMRAASG
jgi:hypothetical protein